MSFHGRFAQRWFCCVDTGEASCLPWVFTPKSNVWFCCVDTGEASCLAWVFTSKSKTYFHTQNIVFDGHTFSTIL